MELRAQALRHLSEIEERIAGSITKPDLDALYLRAELSPEEYTEILEAAGWTPTQAHAAIMQTHEAKAPDYWPKPAPIADVPHVPSWRGPGRKPSKKPGTVGRLTGHPLEET